MPAQSRCSVMGVDPDNMPLYSRSFLLNYFLSYYLLTNWLIN